MLLLVKDGASVREDGAADDAVDRFGASVMVLEAAAEEPEPDLDAWEEAEEGESVAEDEPESVALVALSDASTLPMPDVPEPVADDGCAEPEALDMFQGDSVCG